MPCFMILLESPVYARLVNIRPPQNDLKSIFAMEPGLLTQVHMCTCGGGNAVAEILGRKFWFF